MSYIDKDVKRVVEIYGILLNNTKEWDNATAHALPAIAAQILSEIKDEIIKRQTIETTCEGSE